MYWILLIFWAFGFMVLWKIPLIRFMDISVISNKSVSIIIPARNEERNLGRLLASLASQACRPKEIIVMDDHSTDKTAAIALSYGVQVMYLDPLPSGWLGKPWALSGYHDVMLRGLGFADVWEETAVLFGFATFFFLIALWRFRFTE